MYEKIIDLAKEAGMRIENKTMVIDQTILLDCLEYLKKKIKADKSILPD